MATVRVLSNPNGSGGLRISGPKLCGCCSHEVVEIQPEELTARERHWLQGRAAIAWRGGYPDADWLEEMVDRAYESVSA